MKVSIHELKDRLSEDVLIERLKSLSWARWLGGKPQLRPGLVKEGEKSIADSLLEDRR